MVRKYKDSEPPKKTPEDLARSKVCALMRSKGRPVLIGEVAMAIGPYWTLEATEELLQRMSREEIVRPLTDEEKQVHGMREGFLLV